MSTSSFAVAIFSDRDTSLPLQSTPQSKQEGEAEAHAVPAGRCGVQAAAVAPGDTVAIVGVGPIGLAALQTAALLSPRATYVLDINDARLQVRSSAAGLLVQETQGQTHVCSAKVHCCWSALACLC